MLYGTSKSEKSWVVSDIWCVMRWVWRVGIDVSEEPTADIIGIDDRNVGITCPTHGVRIHNHSHENIKYLREVCSPTWGNFIPHANIVVSLCVNKHGGRGVEMNVWNFCFSCL